MAVPSLRLSMAVLASAQIWSACLMKASLVRPAEPPAPLAPLAPLAPDDVTV